jgi:hypothetical protein
VSADSKPADVDALVKLARETKAIVEAPGVTPGPWEYDPVLDGTIEAASGGAVAHVAQHVSMRAVVATGQEYSHADAALIAHGRTALLLLADGVLELAEENAKLLAERDEARRELLLDVIRYNRAWVCAIRNCPGVTRAWNAPRSCPVCKREGYITQGSNEDPRVVAHDEPRLREAMAKRGWTSGAPSPRDPE